MKQSVLLLGASGMLGSMILDIFSQDPSIDLSATIRTKKQHNYLTKKYPHVSFFVFDAEKDSLNTLLRKTQKITWIINAIGIIKPFIHDDNEEEVKRAYKINSVFPSEIAKAIIATSIQVIQIATDCVFSGKKGGYIETDQHDALDIYGKTKSLGEVACPNFTHLRVSIIGPEKGTKKSLLEWFLSQKKKEHLSGFTNHLWNGITTYHFAKICLGIIKNKENVTLIQHIVPGDEVTKHDLLKIFSKAFQRGDLHIAAIKSPTSVNRTLSTIHDTINKKLWRNAGYKTSPEIEEMVEELAEYMKERKISSQFSPQRKRRSKKGVYS